MRRRLVLSACVLGLAAALGLVTPAAAQFVSSYVARTFTSSAPSGVNGFVCKTAGCRIDVGPGANDFWYSDGASIKTDGPVSTISAYVSTAASGNNGFALTQNNARLDLGTGASDYLYSDGSTASVGGDFRVNSTMLVGSGVFSATNSNTAVWLRGAATDGSTAIAVKLSNSASLANATAKIAEFYSDNGTTAKAFVDSSGTIGIGGGSYTSYLSASAHRMGASQAISTCASGIEGLMIRLSSTGGTGTLTQTRFCVCVSDGAASPVYSWRNLISGTAGNATTCNP